MIHRTAMLRAAAIVMLLHAHTCFAATTGLLGYTSKPLEAVTGEVATVQATGTDLRQLEGTGIGIEIREFTAFKFHGPSPFDACGTWLAVSNGALVEVVVDGIQIELASRDIRDGLVRTEDFGNWTIYTYLNEGRVVHAKVAVVVAEDHLPLLKKQIEQKATEQSVEQTGAANSGSAGVSPE